MSFEKACNYHDYKRFLNLLKDFKVFHKEVNLVLACAEDLSEIIINKQKNDLYHVCCALIQRLRVTDFVNGFENHDVICSYGMKNRKDHECLSQLFNDSIKNSKWIPLAYYYKLHLSLFKFFPYFIKVKKNTKLSFLSTCLIAARMTAYAKMIDDLDAVFKSKDLSQKKFVPFCAPNYTETLLSLYFNTKGVTTFCTLHGNFGRYMQKIANDVVNGCCIPTDYVLTFGNVQKEDLVKDFGVKDNRIFPAGNPKYPYKNLKYKNSFKSGIILGGIWLYDNDLLELLPIAERIAVNKGITFDIKPHPISKIKESVNVNDFPHIHFLDNSITINELFKSGKYDFAITHNTATYYECMYYNIKPLRWAMNENLNFEGGLDRFSNYDELDTLIESVRKEDPNVLSLEGEKLLIGVFGMGINKYDELVNSLSKPQGNIYNYNS